MSAVSWILLITGIAVGLVLLEFVGVLYVLGRYGKEIYRIFETKPLFAGHSVKPQPDGQEVEMNVNGSRTLRGTYFKHTSKQRRGVLLFCHEFTANRWLFEPYIGSLRNDGFDLFTFDFCNHGASDGIEGYDPLHWVTSHEVADVQAALDYLKSRPDAAPQGVGIFGVSKGGGAAIAAAAKDKFVQAIVTDGAFPTNTVVTDYTIRWCVIYVRLRSLYKLLPRFFWSLLTFGVVLLLGRRHNVYYVQLEWRIRQLAGRPLLMINGERDNYIYPAIAKRFFSYASEPKELWIVPKAKHNGCLDVDPETYRSRVREFFMKRFPLPSPAEAVEPEQHAPTDPNRSQQPEKILTPRVSTA